MRKCCVKCVALLCISIWLITGCGMDDVYDASMVEGDSLISQTVENEMIEAEKTESETTQAKKPISEYKDCREVVPDTYVPEGDYEIKEHSIYGCFGDWEDNVEELCAGFVAHKNKLIIAGEVTGDICYSGSWSDTEPSHPYGFTYYTFAVTEVFYGELAEAETLITVKEEQGYVKSPDREDLYGYSHYSGNPAVQAGDKYVLFLDMPEEAPDGEGYIYSGVNFFNKYFMCEDGLYRRYEPELNFFAYEDKATGKWVSAEELTYDEMKDAIINGLNHIEGPVTELVKDEWETLIRAVPVDLEGDGAKEHLEIVAKGIIDMNDTEAVRKFVEDGGTILVRLRQDDGELLDYSVMYLNAMDSGNGQFFLVNCDGKERILHTETYEDRWSGSMGAEIMTIYATRGNDFKMFARDNNYELYADYFIKMKRNPTDMAEEARSAKADGYKAFLEPYLKDAQLLIAVDGNWESLVKYSTEENVLDGSAYFDEYWQREETFVDDGRYYK